MPRVGGPSSSKPSASSSATPTPTKSTYHVPFFGPPALKNPIRMQKTYEYDDEDEDEENDEGDEAKNRKGNRKKAKNTISPATHSRLENIAEILNYWNRGYLEDFMKGLAYRGDKGLPTKKLAKPSPTTWREGPREGAVSSKRRTLQINWIGSLLVVTGVAINTGEK